MKVTRIMAFEHIKISLISKPKMLILINFYLFKNDVVTNVNNFVKKNIEKIYLFLKESIEIIQ